MARQRRPGLTLIELIVVLVILVGLAGIIIPMLPNMLGRVHTSSGATNMVEITKLVQLFEQLNFGYPDGWDALTDGTNLVAYLPNEGGTPVGGQIIVGNLTTEELAALNAAGITSVHFFATATPASPTFDPYQTPLPTSGTVLTTASNIAFLNAAVANQKLGLSPTGRYVAFGLGKRCTMIGKVAAEAPVAFSDEPALNPANFYGRFLVLFKVSEGGVGLPRATMAGVVSMHPGQVDGVNEHLEEYYNIVKGN